MARGRLRHIHDGVYALVSREQLSQMGRWMAAVLACGPDAALSDESAGCHTRFWEQQTRGIEITVPSSRRRQLPGLLIHRRSLLSNDTVIRNGIPTTSPNCTLVALAARFSAGEVEGAISAACFRNRTTPEQLLRYCDTIGNRKGVAKDVQTTLQRVAARLDLRLDLTA